MWLLVVAALLALFLLRRWHRERQTVPRLSEKFVLITGCDSGFGNLLARQLDARGLRWLSRADFAKVLDVNLLGVVEVTLSLLPLLRRARGRVVNVASVMGRVSFFGGGYCISKFGVEAFSDSLRRELRPFGVRVSIIEPGGFRTGMLDPAPMVEGFVRLWERLPAEAQAAYGRHYPEKYAKATTLVLQRLTSSRLSHVTDAMAHALLSRCPRSRYTAGWDARLLFLPLSYCPTWLSDTLLGFFLPIPAGGV
ncbi:RDH16 dehydrogenase, partial [Chloropsis hardwickii]|nr:RDH16 dehydrogenase [Chloropsis hardwickii]